MTGFIKHWSLVLFSFALIFSSCVEDQGNSGDPNEKDDPKEEKTSGDDQNDNQMVRYEGEIFSIPSPIQSAIKIRQAGISFNEEQLHNISNASTYESEFQKALNLGVYGADLAYLANFGNKQKSIDYFKVVESLANDLDIKSAIDNTILTRFYDNIDNRDSLYAINSEFYRAGDRYLKDNERNKVASLIIAGGWIEAMHFSVDAAKDNGDLRRMVGEQKSALNSLLNLMSKYDDEQVKTVRNGLSDLKTSFEGLEIEYIYQKPIDDPDNKTTYLLSKSDVIVSDEDLAQITEKLQAVRDRITQ